MRTIAKSGLDFSLATESAYWHEPLTEATVATEQRRSPYQIDLGRVVSKYIGETEKNLDVLFAAAAAAGMVMLFFDEAEAFFGKRPP